MIKIYDEIYLNEMARVGWIPVKSIGSIEVYVHTNDSGNVPHFHIRKYGKSNNFEWETCIEYNSAKYFLHGKYKDKLPNSSISKELDKMLRTNNPKDPGRTYWQSAIVAWNSNNFGIELPFDLQQPDYTKLK